MSFRKNRWWGGLDDIVVDRDDNDACFSLHRLHSEQQYIQHVVILMAFCVVLTDKNIYPPNIIPVKGSIVTAKCHAHVINRKQYYITTYTEFIYCENSQIGNYEKLHLIELVILHTGMLLIWLTDKQANTIHHLQPVMFAVGFLLDYWKSDRSSFLSLCV